MSELKDIKTAALIGLGALGVMYAERLSKKLPKENLRIIADKGRVKRYQSEGIYCNGKKCDFHYVSSEEKGEPVDLLIFTVKFNGLMDAIKLVKNQVGENTIIISALNGISSEKLIGEEYGMDKMIYCVAQNTDAQKVGNQMSYENIGFLCIGDEEPGIISQKVKKVMEFFDRTDFPYEAVTDMKHRQFGKFMFNVGLNQTVAVFEGDYSTVQQEGEARELMISAMREVMAISKYEGAELTEEDLHYWLYDVLTKVSPKGKPSMRQDMEAKRYSEVEMFAGTVIQMGKKYGVETPVNQMLYNKIKEIEAKY